MKKLLLILIIGFTVTTHSAAEIPSKIKKKIEKELGKAGYDGSFGFKEIDVSSLDEPFITNRSFYRFFADEIDLGIICLTSAMGRYEYFDYWTLMGNDGEIKIVRVYKYRSDHGGEITARSWLKQFNDKQPGTFILGSNVDAVSGATISSNALVDDLNSLDGLIEQISEKLK
jgi:hypothetical protein